MEKEFQNIYDEIVDLMENAISESAHPYRTFSLASVDDKSPKVRTVVLRDFSKKITILSSILIYVVPN